MYPDLSVFFEKNFGIIGPAWLAQIKTYGFFIVLAYLLSSYLLREEVKRKELQGLIGPLSLRTRKGGIDTIYPHELIPFFTLAVAIASVAGGKLFYYFENWDSFRQGNDLLLSSGYTFYGSMLTSLAVVIIFTRVCKISLRHFADAIAPIMFVLYGIGRLGCHFGGDGDWGIFNTAYVSDKYGRLQPAAYTHDIGAYFHDPEYLLRQVKKFGSIPGIPHAWAPAPSWLPNWLFANNFPNNGYNDGVHLAGCIKTYCSVLPVSVFPTSLWEALIFACFFFLLWRLRKKISTPLLLFSLSLVLIGLERILIEKVKVNYHYNFGYAKASQAEIISLVLIMAGIWLFAITKRKQKATKVPAYETTTEEGENVTALKKKSG